MKPIINPSKDLSFKTAEGYLFLNADEIVRFEAGDNCTVVYMLHSERPKQLRNSLKEIDEKVFEYYTFLRSHRAHIVNLKHINEFKKKSRILVTEQGEALIAKACIREFEEFICK